jgi:uncharacterized protein (TIGR01244 family)
MRIALNPHHFFQILFAFVLITLLAVFLAECPSLGQNNTPAKVEGFQEEVPNLMVARPGIYISGQPGEDGLRRLISLRIKTLVNLRPHEEDGARDESGESAGLGMKYVNIPLTPSTFSLQKIEELRCVLKDPKNYPVLIHCRSGNRASGAWFVYRVIFENASIPVALLEARTLGLEPSLEPTLLELIEKAKNQKIEEICGLL